MKNKFWLYFILTLVVYFIVYIGSMYKVINIKKVEMNVVVSKEFYAEVKSLFPQKLQKLEEDLLKKRMSEIESVIDTSINIVFEDVYKQIPKFLDVHYSIKGEYTEIYMALQGDIGKSFRTIIYEDTEYSAKLNKSIKSIVNLVNFKVKKDVEAFDNDLSNSLGLNEDGQKLFTDLYGAVNKDMMKRYDNAMIEILRISGLSAGAGAAVLTKTLSKKMATKITTKIGTKAGIKYLGAAGTAGTGAAIGSIIPGYGTAIGGIVGATIGWFGVDKIILEVDKYYNKEEFAKEIKTLIQKEEANIKNIVKSQIVKHLNEVLNDKKDISQEILLKNLIVKDDYKMLEYQKRK